MEAAMKAGGAEPNLRARVMRGLSWSLVQSWGSHAITFVVFLIIARVLGPHAFGTVVIAYVVLGALLLLVDLGLCDALVRQPDAGQAHFDTAFWAILAASLVLFGAVSVGAGVLAHLLNQPELAHGLMLAVGAGLPLAALGLVQAAILRRNMMFRALAMRTLLATAGGGIVGVAMALAGFGYWSLVAKGLADAALSTALVWRASPYRPRLQFDRGAWRDLFAVGRNLLASRLVDIVNRRADSAIVSAQLGPATLGLYAAAQRIYQTMMESLFMAIQRVSLPAFAQIVHDHARASHALLRMIALTSFFTFPLFAFTALLAEPLIPTLFGARWAAAAPVLSWLCAAGVLFSVSYFNAPLMTAAGRTHYVLVLTVVNMVVNVAGFLIGVRYGAAGVAAAFAIRGYLVLPLNLHLLRRTIGLGAMDYLRALLPNLAATLCAVALVGGLGYLLPGTLPGWARLLVLVAAAPVAQLLVACTLFRRSTLEVLMQLHTLAAGRARVAAVFGRIERLLGGRTE